MLLLNFRLPVPKDVRLGHNNVVYLDSVTEVEVDSSNEALEQFYKGRNSLAAVKTFLEFFKCCISEFWAFRKSNSSHGFFTCCVECISAAASSLYTADFYLSFQNFLLVLFAIFSAHEIVAQLFSTLTDVLV